MVVRFDDISGESKLWIYQSNRPFKDELINSLEKKISQFLSSWTSHGSELNSAFTIKYNLFLFIALVSIASLVLLILISSFPFSASLNI